MRFSIPRLRVFDLLPSPTVWTNLLPRIESYLNARREEHLAVARERQKGLRQSVAEPFLEALRIHLKTTRSPMITAPPIDVLFYLDGVKPFWEPDEAVFNPVAWTTSLPATPVEINALEAKLKLDLFTALVAAHSEALVKAPEIGLKALAPASLPTPTEVDAFLSKPTSIVHCGKCDRAYHSLDIFLHITSDCLRFMSTLWGKMGEDDVGLPRPGWATVGSEITVKASSIVVAQVLQTVMVEGGAPTTPSMITAAGDSFACSCSTSWGFYDSAGGMVRFGPPSTWRNWELTPSSQIEHFQKMHLPHDGGKTCDLPPVRFDLEAWKARDGSEG